MHPLSRPDSELGGSSVRAASSSAPVQLPSGSGAWDVVDEAVHRAFINGLCTRTSGTLNLTELVAALDKVTSPELPNGESNRGLPAAPRRGLARMECLMPRPFYVPINGEGGPVIGAPSLEREIREVAEPALSEVAEPAPEEEATSNTREATSEDASAEDSTQRSRPRDEGVTGPHPPTWFPG
ncbi:unnamed protein product [Polarella glacialis]|uniref:Uncharacterized protein n=1 Tax=Polarella glacialis TaxID=89957 RepID=A0A813HQ32_POLGL|nr:unnamed protein product [Polarella glacialis]